MVTFDDGINVQNVVQYQQIFTNRTNEINECPFLSPLQCSLSCCHFSGSCQIWLRVSGLVWSCKYVADPMGFPYFVCIPDWCVITGRTGVMFKLYCLHSMDYFVWLMGKTCSWFVEPVGLYFGRTIHPRYLISALQSNKQLPSILFLNSGLPFERRISSDLLLLTFSFQILIHWSTAYRRFAMNFYDVCEVKTVSSIVLGYSIYRIYSHRQPYFV